jgi:hypothetical protein
LLLHRALDRDRHRRGSAWIADDAHGSPNPKGGARPGAGRTRKSRLLSTVKFREQHDSALRKAKIAAANALLSADVDDVYRLERMIG